ncbi:MAG: TIGR02147 family protein [Fibrobacteria bacterium]
MEPLSTYLDYRQYLRDFYAEQKRRNPRYSHRLFAQKAGLTSTGFFSEVMNGKRQIAPATLLRFCKALKLNAQDQAYFEHLVAFDRAKTMEDRNHHFARLAALRGARVDIVGQERYEFYRRWYHAALRELIACRPLRARTRADFALLGQSLEPSITAAKAKASVELLLRLGFIVRGPNGILTQATPLISTGDLKSSPPSTLDIDNFQAAMLDLARKALDKQTRARRDFSTLTLSLSESGVAAAQAEIAALRKKLMVLAEQDKAADRVRQFNFQSFPLSKA